jgi:hypothetical protein
MMYHLVASAGIFDALTNMGTSVYQGLMKILLISGAISVVAAVLTLMFVRDDRKASAAKTILIRVFICIAIACLLGAIISTLLSLTSGYQFTSTTSIAAS